MKLLLLGIAIILFGIVLTMNSSGMTSGLGIGFVGLCLSIAGMAVPDNKEPGKKEEKEVDKEEIDIEKKI